jgi:hypothetical protein
MWVCAGRVQAVGVRCTNRRRRQYARACRRSAAFSGSRSRCSLTIMGLPHFHGRDAEGSAKVRIDTLEVIDSTSGRRQLRFVLAWADLHQGELSENRKPLALVRRFWRSNRSDGWLDARHNRRRRCPPRRPLPYLRRRADGLGRGARPNARTSVRGGPHPRGDLRRSASTARQER